MARRKKPTGRIESEQIVENQLYGYGFYRPNSQERLCYRPEEANRVIVPFGGWVFVLRSIPVEAPPTPGCGYWAVPWPDGKEGYKDGRYSIRISLSSGGFVRLWPYEYTILSQGEIDRALADDELIFHPMSNANLFQDMPEIQDMIGALMLDGLSLPQAVYELAGVQDEISVEQIPAPGWFEATFNLPWV